MKKIFKVFSWGHANEDTGWGLVGVTKVMTQDDEGVYRVIPLDLGIYGYSTERIKEYLSELAKGEQINYRVDTSSLWEVERDCNSCDYTGISDGAGNGEYYSNSFDDEIDITSEEEKALLNLLDFSNRRENMILNLTQFNKTLEQENVIEPSPEDKATIKDLLVFKRIPEHEKMLERAYQIAEIASHYSCDRAMIGGAPYFLGYIEDSLEEKNIAPLYSFTKRVSEEYFNEKTGANEKKFVFKHEGFVEVAHDGEELTYDASKNYIALNDGYLNITNHNATPDQIANEVKEPLHKADIQKLITFEEMPSEEKLKEVATKVADIVQEEGYSKVMIAGAPYLDKYLRDELDRRDIDSYYAFSEQKVITNEDGSSTKYFKHLGFVPSKNTAEYYQLKSEEEKQER